MFKELKLKIAANRIQRKTSRKNTNSRRSARKQTGFWVRVLNIICWPFRAIARIARRVWSWVCNIDLVGLVNLTLLAAIIVLFSMLIIDIVGCARKSVVVIADAPAVAVVPEKPQITVTAEAAPATLKQRKPVLPIKRNPVTRKFESHTVTVATTQAAQENAPKVLQGDIIIDRRGAAPVLTDDVRINGNLYLQNMRKYILPCGATINGNLFLRDVEMLHFCGDFTVTGNIYVSPRSSFGPIPRTARLGGQVIL